VDRLDEAVHALTFLYQDVLHCELGDVPLPQPPRLLDRVRQALRVRHYSPRTEECYVQWTARFVRFHGLRHPCEMAGRRSPSSRLARRGKQMRITRRAAIDLTLVQTGLWLGRFGGVADPVHITFDTRMI